ncbi:MAG: ABC transporter permease [Clostridia bacterium]|nr:ABC transporter permease [Clostridia bacterium]
MDFALLFAYAVHAGTPLLFATLGEMVTEKSGNLNLGVEGMMLMGAVMGFQVGIATSNPLLAVVGAAAAGALGGLIFAFLTVTLRANQVVSGLALTIFGTGFAGFFGQKLTGKIVPGPITTFFGEAKVPLLSDIPFVGKILFAQNLFVYFGYVAAIALGVYLFHTRKGLNLRAVGENPAAADASGINISLYKYTHILLGGALCGLGGAYLSLVYVPTWKENITAGRGWIAVALVIFTTWSPYRAIIGSYLFGCLDIIGFRIQDLKIKVSPYIIDMLPYIVTIVVLVFISMRKSKENAPPKGLGNPYFREDR